MVFNLPTVDGRRLSRISASDERYLISGGTDQVARALAAQHQPHLRLGRKLVALDMSRAPVRLAFADGSEAAADRVILASPVSMLAGLRIDGRCRRCARGAEEAPAATRS